MSHFDSEQCNQPTNEDDILSKWDIFWDTLQLPVDQAKIVAGLDVLVNSAGVLVTGSVETLTTAGYDNCMNINTRTAFILTQQAVPHLLKTKVSIVV